MNLVVNYIKDSYHELELVRWPTRQQAVRLSAVVLAFTLVSAVVFGLVDYLLSSLLYLLLSSTI